MKKNYLFSSLAMAAMLFTTACQEQDVVEASMADTDVVTFTVNTQDVATRATETGEGSLADKLYYGVYEYVNGQWNLIEAISKTDEAHAGFTAEDGGLVTLRLAKQKEYSIVFWAEAEDGSLCDVDWDARTLKVNSSINANAESYDAFWAYEHIASFTGAQKKEVTLNRPFAQLNIGVSDEDWTAAEDASVELQNSAVTVKRVPTTMNLVDGTVGDFTDATSVAYASAAIPSSEEWEFPVDGHKYLALNYVLVGTEQSLVDVELAYTDDEGGNYSSTFTSVPVRRNYRTNIYGNILTSDADYNVKIEAGLGGDYNTEDLLEVVLANGGKFTLLTDMTWSDELTIPEGKEVEIDLNGNTLTVAAKVSVKGNLKVGNGNIYVNAGDYDLNFSFVAEEGCTIDLSNANVEVAEKNAAVTVGGNDVTVNLNKTMMDGYNGIFAYPEAFDDNWYENLKITLTESTITGEPALYLMYVDATVILDEKSSAKVFGVYGADTNVDVVYSGNKPEVTGDGTANSVTYYTYDEYLMREALANGGDMTLSADLTLTKSFAIPAGEKANIDLAGHTLTVAQSVNVEGELNISNGNIVTNMANGGVAFEIKENSDAEVNMENVTMTVNGACHAILVGQQSGSETKAVVNLNNTKIYAENGYGVHAPFTINCLEINITNGSEITGNKAVFITNAAEAVINIDATSKVENIIAENGNINVICSGSNKPETHGSANFIQYTDKAVYDLNKALANGATGEISLVENVNYGTITVNELKNVTIKGAEGSVMIFKTTADTKIENVTLANVNFAYTGATADCGIVIDVSAQIDNLVIDGCTVTGTGAKAGRGLSGLNNNASIIIKNTTFKDLGYPIYAWGGYKSLKIENCTFDNIKSWAIMPQSGFDGDLTVTGCTFKDCLGGGLVKAGILTAGHTFTFTNNTITGCTIAGDHNWFQFDVSAGTSVISGNTMDGVAWTPGTAEGLK